MNTEKIDTLRTPAYAPYESFNRLLSRLKDALPLPEPLDSSFWARMKFSGSMTSMLKGTLIFLNLLTPDNKPTKELEDLVKTNPGERTAIVARIFDRAYESILTKLDLERASPGQLRTEFKNIGADGVVGKKAISFFLALAKDSGKKLHPHLTARQPRALGAKRPGPKPKSESEPPADPENPKPPPGFDPNLHPMILGLLKELPPPGKELDDKKKEALKQYFDVVLNIIYKKNSG